jgi:DNA-binding response OmpR family regulator
MSTPETDLPDLQSLGVPRPIIIVADDDVLIRNVVTILLQRQGYLVLSASDGQEGLELSRKYPGTIDLVITDVGMPRLNGMDLVTHLQEERPGIKILVMSGEESNEIASKNANLPFLPKPFDGETLLSRVHALLDAHVESLK